jgi:hypothetical protein
VMGSSMFQGVAMHQICYTRVGSMGGREMETSWCCVLVVGNGIKILGGGWGGCFCCLLIRNIPLFMCLQRKNKGMVCVEEMWIPNWGYVWDETSRREEGRWSVACCVSVFHFSLFSVVPHVLHPDF